MGKDISAKPDNLRLVPRTLMEERDGLWATHALVMNTDVDRYTHTHIYTHTHTQLGRESMCKY